MRGDFFQAQHGDILTPIREHFKGLLIGNMGYSADEAAEAISSGKLDAVAFGTPFLANPDLPTRFKLGASLNAVDAVTFYTQSAEGYTDYPALETATLA
jgi:N-ethylmaleimide reductase